jgi:5-methylcytosine-specific restriction endonuclease McrA
LVLQCFNRTIALCIKNWGRDFLAEYRTEAGYFRRCYIPEWLEKAVFHRDQGRCVFCNKDLTGIVNTLASKNFDHIVPLSFYGVNDPTNLQLSCGECNRRKSNKNKNTSTLYAKWW